MLNKQTTNFINNKIYKSTIKFNISNPETIDYLSKFEDGNTISKNLLEKRGVSFYTRNALATINDSYTLKKSDLKNLSLIGQFDKKFCVYYRSNNQSIIVFDQHAIHERILYEYYQQLLINEFYNLNNKIDSNDVKLNLFTDIYGIFYLKQKKFEINPKNFNINIKIFNNSFVFNKKSQIQTFLNFTWTYSIDKDIITFYTVPIIFDKIHKIEDLMNIFSYIINNIEEFFKNFNEKKDNIFTPFDFVIKSKACRNAIKFNDELDNTFMKLLITELSLCKNPFLCAHGRHNYFILYKSTNK